LTNFDCGIEKLCYADQVSTHIQVLLEWIAYADYATHTNQLCHPVRGKEWYILVAAQEWNTFMNAAYQSIGWAMTMMQGEGPAS
jgi:hypothetical protein